jgi:hypothetical protein
MKKLPTDLEILNFIYDTYYKEFSDFQKDNKSRETKIYVPIDCAMLAKHFSVDGDIIFGRLYYHLANKYKYQHSVKEEVKIFEFKVGDDSKCVHFPILASVVSELREHDRKYRNTIRISVIAIVLSIIALTITVYEKIPVRQQLQSTASIEAINNKVN